MPPVLPHSQDDSAKLAKIRQVLANFDWDGDSDLQYALEEIESIASDRPRNELSS